ncbi:hypothetical protein [Massilia yuzhufengensis]|uniref:Uncharacterized protein n=1 Tax=Massilia yuzhufengensis TaxID=1164594 RepID=A0A1I1PMT1_9BURK|nr:hypothetical protein [Massilia yuzhufengensis]SFD11111.1 hypothetical protein SAMN05216204_11673 [Massilia yuzhufengensis]
MNAPLVTCRSLTTDGSCLTVTASVRPRGGRADVKCSVPDAPALAQRMQEVVRLARHTEPRFDSRDQVVLSLDRAPAPGSRDWELACVLADRMVRGLWQPQRPVVANGWSDAWHLGRVDGHGLRQVPPGVLAGGEGGLPHLGALTGHPDPAAAVSAARAWFPLVSGGAGDSLCWVEVSVRPAAHGEDEESSIAGPGVDAALQAQVRAVLAGARHHDGRGAGQWRTTVRFGEARFQGASFELALVMADRMARGREFLARGRVLATGQSSAWHAGRVDTVEGLGPKCALLAREAAPGDRILVPRAWEAQLPPLWREELRARGASVACVDRIGII